MNTLDYYNENAESFAAGTANADMSESRERFQKLVAPKGHILDWGCGSGRDSLEFLKAGYSVEAVDASEELCKLASKRTGLIVRCERFEELTQKEAYDGIWACASLLHEDEKKLPDTMALARQALKPGGVFYLSFKYGNFRGVRNDRYFVDMTEASLNILLDCVTGFELVEQWVSSDVRPGREEEKWLNVLLRKPGKSDSSLIITAEPDDLINYAMQQHGSKVLREIRIKNSTGSDLEQLMLEITSDTELLVPFKMGIDKVKNGEEIRLKDLKIKVNGDYLANLTERVKCLVTVCVKRGEEELASEKKEITALAFDEWSGFQYSPEMLAAFSLPNHPVVLGLVQQAAHFLEKWTKDPSLTGYQTKNPNRVKQMAAAAFAAIQQKNVIYANPPASFETVGQRVRLADMVLETHLGTCMDMTLLYVATLEAMGLNPFLVLCKGHIFGGVWLVEDSFPEIIMPDPTHLEKRMSNGINEMLVVECTAMNAGRIAEFDEAVSSALKKVKNHGEFEFVIDVARARSMGVRPLPVRVMTETGYVLQYAQRSDDEVTSAPADIVTNYDLEHLESGKAEVSKQVQWERKLLDLSLRNMLINMRFTKSVVPLLTENAGVIEDALFDGEEFLVLPRPADMEACDEEFCIERLTKLGAFVDYIALEGKHKRLHSLYNEKDLNSSLTKMFRSAKTSLEENGASTLYLAMGLLRWKEENRAEVPFRYAPLLLIPVDIIRKSAAKGYSLRMKDEDTQLNITLLEFLKENFELEVPGLNPLPTNDHGLDTPKIFAIVRHAVMELPGWDVEEACFIGNFSFSQFVMWNDIHSRTDMLERNNVVRSLMNGAVDWDCSIPEDAEFGEAYLPITADASQLRAINMAAAGVSFVLHGPPGTGKSQTITAMISNALTKGQTVLFVAEKMAALEVVQKRLDALGIGDFCMELHSNKATKKSVLDQLRKVLEIEPEEGHTEYKRRVVEIREMREELDGYGKVLHEERQFGKSIRELIDLYETIPKESEELRFEAGYVDRIEEGDLEDQERALQQLLAAGKEIGHPSEHPLSPIHQTEYTQTLKLELEESVKAYETALVQWKQAVEKLLESFPMEEPVYENDWETVAKRAQSIVDAEAIPAMLFASDYLDRDFDKPLQYVKEKALVDAKKEQLLGKWNETFLQMDMQPYHVKYEEANKKFLGKGKAIANLVSELQAFSKSSFTAEQIPALLAEVEVYEKSANELKQKTEELSYEWRQIVEKHPTEEALHSYREEVKEDMAAVREFAAILENSEKEGKRAAYTKLAQEVCKGRELTRGAGEKLTELLKLSFDSQNPWMEEQLQFCEALLENLPNVKDFIVYRKAEEYCKNSGLQAVCEAYRKGLAHEKLMNVYRRSIYRAIIISYIEKEPVLNGFTGTDFNELIHQFKKLDEEFMELTKQEMYYQLTSQLPSAEESVQVSKELNILRRAISSNGRGISIRSLFDQIPTILSRICPCMLMSPISVAQYISAEYKPFDIVVFDEASQLPTCKAVGVLARGKNAVIVGDPNQMPPTSFFAGNMIDEDNLDIEDLDSILDDCLALGMPSLHLKWHYRSRHESLIAFSNQEFYENSMLTFPSVNDREKKVTLQKVDGFFDRKKGRVNEAEAEAILAEIRRRYEEESHREESVGVVTFNISQQTLIEDRLQAEFSKDPDFEKWANEGEDRLFVKNLENVQGDERDVILFSVAFGPDEEGKLSLNFGPLNKEGGWKRLNVAVTRARKEMVVFTTMTSEMIDLKRTKSKGVESLKNFLEYAGKGRLSDNRSEGKGHRKQGILDQLCKALDNAGYTYQRTIGHSKFKMDLAVVDPENSEKYLLGILLDGDSYRQASNTKDREVAQKSVLNGLGWKLHRIWTMDWWDNKEKEINKILVTLAELTGKNSEG